MKHHDINDFETEWKFCREGKIYNLYITASYEVMTNPRIDTVDDIECISIRYLVQIEGDDGYHVDFELTPQEKASLEKEFFKYAEKHFFDTWQKSMEEYAKFMYGG